MNSSDAVFIGRHREITDLKAALGDALSGHGRLVMLAGQPGIGKTRTAQELATMADQRGAETFSIKRDGCHVIPSCTCLAAPADYDTGADGCSTSGSLAVR